MDSGELTSRLITWLAVICATGCTAHARDAQRAAEVERQRAYWQANSVEMSAPNPPSEGERPGAPREPRLLCNDGTLSTCTPLGVQQDCCISQGGVHRDSWGNTIAREPE